MRASLAAQMVKNLPAMWENAFDPSVGKRDPLEKGMVTHCSILAWRIPCTEEPGVWRATVSGVAKSQTELLTHTHTHTHTHKEMNSLL